MITNKKLGTTTELVASKITVDWNPIGIGTDLGNVRFDVEKMVSQDDASPPVMLKRGYYGTMASPIADIIGKDYTIIDPTSGEEVTIPGVTLMLLIKAVTDDVLQAKGEQKYEA